MSRHRSNQNLPVFTPPNRFRQVTGIGSRATALRWEKEDPSFPKRIRIGGVTAWRTDELLDYLESRERVR